MEIVEGVYLVEGTNVNVYLILNNQSITVIDTAIPGQLDTIVRYIKSIGRNVQDVSTIILTHCHIDHMGNVSEFKSKSGAKVLVHEEDAPFVSGKEKMPLPEGLLQRNPNMATAISNLKYLEPDTLLRDGDMINGLRIIHTPGHTPGSISLYDRERKVLFVGDELRYINGEIQGPPEQFTQNMKLAIDSMSKYLDIDFEIMLSGHGEPLMPGAHEKIRKFYESLKVI